MKTSNDKLCDGGYMMAPQNYSINDGEGIRTLLFFAKCPLRCKWCANPESYIEGIENDLVNYYSCDEILTIVDKQKIFYRQSGGGVTFSGGEATQQLDLLEKLSSKFYDDGLNLAIETSGYFKYDSVKAILNRMDLIFVDIKMMDGLRHKEFTGRDNKLILNNIALMGAHYKNVVIRIPVINGVNATEDNIRKTAKFVKKMIMEAKIELLPYHTLGTYKYAKLELQAPSTKFQTPSKEQMQIFASIIREEGVELVSYK